MTKGVLAVLQMHQFLSHHASGVTAWHWWCTARPTLDEKNVDISTRLVKWTTQFQIAHIALKELLVILCPSLPDLPQDPHTLLRM